MTGSSSRVRPSDQALLAWRGLRAHPLRAALSAAGIAIGIAAMIAVLGISVSSQARVQAALSELGTNLLTATAGNDLLGKSTALPEDAADRVRRIDGVEHAAWTADLDKVKVYRNALVDPNASGGIGVLVAGGGLLDATGASVRVGKWLEGDAAKLPVTVLGASTAERLGIREPGALIWLGGQEVTVVGILDPSPLVPELNGSALVGGEYAKTSLGFTGAPTTLYERSTDEAVTDVRKMIPPTLAPKSPTSVLVSRPSDALAAKNAVDQAFTGLLIGVGSIALLVGGIGVANTMIVAVLERRNEIGLRRALGATRRNIRSQFLTEAVLLAALGGIAGVVLGVAVTAGVALANGWIVTIPVPILGIGLAVTIVVGGLAGILPAARAARVPPTAALSA